jgi:hypothetical protein
VDKCAEAGIFLIPQLTPLKNDYLQVQIWLFPAQELLNHQIQEKQWKIWGNLYRIVCPPTITNKLIKVV